MKRPRKNYRLSTPTTTLTGLPGSLIVNFLGPDGQPENTFDFSTFNNTSQVTAEIALAFRNHHAGNSSATRIGDFHSLRRWFSFLEEQNPTIASMEYVNSEVLRSYIAWLDRKPWTKSTRHSMWSALKQMVQWLKRNRPSLVASDLEIPFNAFPRKNAETPAREALTRSEMEAVLLAARKDIEASWITFQTGKELLAAVDHNAIALERDLGKLDLDNLGVLLAIVR